MGIVSYTKVQRLGTHAIIAIVGESGSGKTYSAILLARGLVGPSGRLAMLDTESGRGRMYANLGGGYDYGELTPPFTPERYVEAIKAAEEAGYEALIIDSGSHEWEGIGGTLDAADAGKSSQGKPLTGLIKWAQPKARHKRFVQALLNTRMHLVICLRAKEKLVQMAVNGKQEIVSQGYVSVQDKRFVYETTVQLFMPKDDPKKLGIPRIDKCPEDLLPAFPHGQRISTETGKKIAEWISGGIAVDADLEALRHEAEDAADGGTAVLRAFWDRLGKPQQKMLAPFMENLKSIAAVADADVAPSLAPEEDPAEIEPATAKE